MSIEEVARVVPLSPHRIFGHSRILRQEIESFRDAFERNERYRELDGLIRKNHQIYEANETNVLALLQSDTLKELNERMNRTAERLEALPKPHFREDAFEDVDLLQLNQTDILRLAEGELKKKPVIEMLESVVESCTPTDGDVQQQEFSGQ